MLLLMIPYLAAFAFAALELAGGLRRRAPRTPLLPSWVWVAVLAVTYAVQLGAIRYGATHLAPAPAWRLAMPIPVMYVDSTSADAVSAIFLLCAAMQSYALLALYRARPSLRIVAGGAAMLLAMSLCAPALLSFDPYGYVHNALLGLQAYAPTDRPFTGEYRVIDLWFGKPTATLYGPLWFPIVRMVTVAMPTLLMKLLALRAFNAALYVVLIVLLRSLGLPRRAIVVAALNPGLLFQLVADAHNDIIPIDAILAAAVLARRHPYAAFGAIAIAGLVKLPYVVLGLPVLAVVRSRRLRYIGCAAAVALTLAGSWLGGGQAYARALTNHSLTSHVQNAWHLLPVLLAGAALAIAVAGGRRLIGALWIVPSIGAFGSPVLFPWYLTWSLPYALARRRVAGFLLVGFPLVSAMITPELMRAWTLFFVFPLAVALSAARTPARPPRALRPE